MRWTSFVLSSLVLVLPATVGVGQDRDDRSGNRRDPRAGMNARFLEADPKVGATIPDVTLHSEDGQPFELASVKGSYTVLVFGCLT